MCEHCGSKDGYTIKENSRIYEGDGYRFTLKVKTPFCNKCNCEHYDKKQEEKIRNVAHQIIVLSKSLLN